MIDTSKMTTRVKEIYIKLYEDSAFCTKENLANYFGVTLKTIENSLNAVSEIEYDKKLKKYRFSNLLPSYIPYRIYYDIFKDAISNEDLKKDFFIIDKFYYQDDIFMIETAQLSQFSQKVIIFYLAINNNSILKVEYTGNSKAKEIKYIQPNTLFSTGFDYCSFITYDERNIKDVGETRTFKFSNIGNITLVEYSTNKIFKQDKKGNVYGEYKKDKYVTLIFDRVSGDFFKSSKIFNKQEYEVVVGIDSENIIVKMYYNHLDGEVVKLIQQWMPHIKIHTEEPLKETIESKIKHNLAELLMLPLK